MTSQVDSRMQMRAVAEQFLREARQRRFADLDGEALAWLALPPLWTKSLAERCWPPRIQARMDLFIAQAAESGLCVRTPPPDPEAQGGLAVQFWMPDDERSDAFAYLRERRDQDLGRTAATIGKNITYWQGLTPVPPEVVRWAQLAQEVGQGLEHAGDWLQDQVDRMVRGDQTGEAAAWVRMGRTLAEALGGELRTAVDFAARSLQLAYRQIDDKRILDESYVDRPELTAAFRALLEDKGEQWALHYLGMGGVGKTMLLRDIGYSAPTRFGAAVARIDFDYIKPEFPIQRPGQLLLELAAELQIHFRDPEQKRQLVRLENQLNLMHEKLETVTFDDPMDRLSHREFKNSLEAFVRLLNLLPPPVVLILDTCEELVKLQLRGAPPLHLRATFKILEQVRAGCPGVRVIFAGRRLLAQGGAGWEAAPSGQPWGGLSLLEFKPYLRLQLVRAFSAPNAEDLFDKRQRSGGRTLSRNIRKSILQVTPDYGVPARVSDPQGRPLAIAPALRARLQRALVADRTLQDFPWHFAERYDDHLRARFGEEDEELHTLADAALSPKQRANIVINAHYYRVDGKGHNALVELLRDPSALDSAEMAEMQRLADALERDLERYSPYDLDLYAKWFQDDPKLTAADIQAGKSDPYVEMRIVNRLGQQPGVKALLPAVALLGRFDKPMLRPAFAGSDSAFDRVFDALSTQEWIKVERGHRGPDEIFLEVKPNLWPRLRAYFQRNTPHDVQNAAQALVPGLKKRLETRPIGHLEPDVANATLALLPDGEAAHLWVSVEQSVCQDQAWDWAGRATRFILGEERGAAGKGASLLQAAVRATYAAANLRGPAGDNPAGNWLEVEVTLHRLDAGVAASPLACWLAQRALLGRIAAAQSPQQRKEALNAFRDDPAMVRMEEWDPWQREQWVGAALAALEALLDNAEEMGLWESADWPWLFARLTQHQREQWHPFAYALAGRAAALDREWQSVERFFRQAEASAATWREEPDAAQAWLDWRASAAALPERVRLEWLRSVPQSPPLEQLQRWIEEATQGRESASQIDAERLVSAALRRWLDQQLVPGELLEALEKWDRYVPGREPLCFAHRDTPPLFATLARGWLARGVLARAQKTLEARLAEVPETKQGASTIKAAQEGMLEIARRLRLHERAQLLLQQQLGPGELDDAAWPLNALTGALPEKEMPTPKVGDPARRVHAWYSSHCKLAPAKIRRAGPLLAAAMQAADQDCTLCGQLRAMSLHLDAEELYIAGRTPALETDLVQVLPTGLVPVHKETEQRPAIAHEYLRQRLRVEVLLEPNFRDLQDALWPGSGSERGSVERAGRPEDPSVLASRLSAINTSTVGVRCAAEIALEEGELLALRLPRLAAPLLSQASDWFSAAGDPLGATQAAVLGMLASIRTNDETARQQCLPRIETCYDQLAASRLLGDLPAWAAWQALCQAPSAKELDALLLPGAGDWPLRLWAALAWTGGRKTQLFYGDWLDLRFGSQPPPEMDVYAPLAKPAGPAKPKAKKRSFKIDWDGVLYWGILIFILTLPVTLYFAFRWLTLRLVAGGFGTGRTILLYVLTWGVLWLLYRQREDIRSRLASRTPAELDLDLAEGEGVLSSEPAEGERTVAVAHLSVGTHWDLRWLPPWVYRTRPATAKDFVRVSLGEPYAEGAKLVGSEIITPLAELQRVLRARSVPLIMRAAPSLAPLPWEALLTLALDSQTGKDRHDTCQFARTAGPVVHPPEAWAGQVALITGEQWARQLQQGWRAIDTRVAVYGAHYELAPSDTFRALHVVGAPRRTSSGIQMEVASKERDYAQGVARSQKGIGPDSLPLARTWMVILQGEPTEGLARGKSDREDSAYLRALAVDMQASGACAVVVIPSLPSGLLEKVFEALAELLNRPSPPDLKTMLRTLTRVRRTIFDYWTDPRSLDGKSGGATSRSVETRRRQLTELALDVCLFWRPEETGSSSTRVKS